MMAMIEELTSVPVPTGLFIPAIINNNNFVVKSLKRSICSLAFNASLISKSSL